jgi:hypothetical protein
VRAVVKEEVVQAIATSQPAPALLFRCCRIRAASISPLHGRHNNLLLCVLLQQLPLVEEAQLIGSSITCMTTNQKRLMSIAHKKLLIHKQVPSINTGTKFVQ